MRRTPIRHDEIAADDEWLSLRLAEAVDRQYADGKTSSPKLQYAAEVRLAGRQVQAEHRRVAAQRTNSDERARPGAGFHRLRERDHTL